ncbi:hypothetical protein D3C72_1812070 [compost metagenome]
MGQGGPGLLAIDHVVVAITYGAGLDSGQVRTGARLGIALAPPVLGAENSWQEARLLFRCSELDDHRGDHVDAKRHDPRGAERRTFLIENVFLHRAPTRTAILHRPTGGQPSALIEQAHPGDLVFFVETLAVAATRGDIGRQSVT